MNLFSIVQSISSWLIREKLRANHTQYLFLYATGVTERKTCVSIAVSGQAPVVQRLDNAIHWINRYPVDKC